MFKTVVREAKRTFFAFLIQIIILFLLELNLSNDKGTAVSYKISGRERITAMLYYLVSSFLCYTFLPYVGFAVVAIRFYKFLTTCLDWLFQRPKIIKDGEFCESAIYSSQNGKQLVEKLRRIRSMYLMDVENDFKTRLEPDKAKRIIPVTLETLNKTEADFLPTFRHPNVAMLYKIYDPRDEFLMFGTRNYGTMWLVIYNEEFSQDKDFFLFALKWTMDMVHGVRYLHDQNLYPLNLEPDNVWVDFGKSKVLEPMSSNAVIGNFKNMQNKVDKLVSVQSIDVHDCYRPPETHLFGPSPSKTVDAEKCDAWGIGMVTLELLTGGLLMMQTESLVPSSFDQRNDVLASMLQSTRFCAALEAAHGDLYTNLLEGRGGLDSTLGDFRECADSTLWIWWVLVADLLKFDPAIRMGIEMACRHSFMTKASEVLAVDSSTTE